MHMYVSLAGLPAYCTIWHKVPIMHKAQRSKPWLSRNVVSLKQDPSSSDLVASASSQSIWDYNAPLSELIMETWTLLQQIHQKCNSVTVTRKVDRFKNHLRSSNVLLSLDDSTCVGLGALGTNLTSPSWNRILKAYRRHDIWITHWYLYLHWD